MVVVTRKHLAEAAAKYRESAEELAAWLAIVTRVRWKSFSEVRGSFLDADMVDGHVVFDIRRNRYRLITVIHFAKEGTVGHIYIRSFLTHKVYENRNN